MPNTVKRKTAGLEDGSAAPLLASEGQGSMAGLVITKGSLDLRTLWFPGLSFCYHMGKLQWNRGKRKQKRARRDKRESSGMCVRVHQSLYTEVTATATGLCIVSVHGS